MAQSIKDILADRYRQLSETVNQLKTEADGFPDGRVSLKLQGKQYYYYHVLDNSEKYLSKKDSETIRALVQKAYVKDVIKASECEMNMIKDVLDGYCIITPEEILDNLPEARKKYVTPVYVRNRFDENWANEPYDKPIVINGFNSIKGDKVRSKSELIIADRMLIRGVPYRYECPLMVNGKIIHLDFTAPRRRDNKLVYIEHCGMVDKTEYAENMVARINDYNKEGIYLGDRLFLTFETSKTPLDISTIDNLIDTHLI